MDHPSKECINNARPGFEIHTCPNMKPKKGDTDMDREYYACAVCGKTDYLDYDEMR